MSKAKYFWITRDKPKGAYDTWTKKPYWNKEKNRWYDDDKSDWETFCPRVFERFTGIYLTGGPRSITKRRLAK